MGHNMLREKENSLNLLKLLLSLGLALSAIGCGIEEKKTPVNNVNSAVEDINNAILGEVGEVSILDVKVGQKVRYEQNYRAEIGSTIKISDTFREAMTKEVNDYEARVVMKEDYYAYSGENIIDEKHSDIVWTESTEGLSAQSLTSRFFNPLSLVPKLTGKTYDYYNLDVIRGNFPLPEATKQKADCGGFVDCVIPGTKVSYLKYTREDGKITKKEEITMTLSRAIPPLLLDPSSGLLPVLNLCVLELYDGQILLNRCLVLRDVKK
jgi:hypothetical protein